MIKRRWLSGLILSIIFVGCNQRGGTDTQADSASQDISDTSRAPVPGPREDRSTFQTDTVIGKYHIAAMSKGDGTMRNLILAFSEKLPGRDSTKADSIIEQDVKGELTRMIATDLDNDRKPEVFCITTSTGTGHYRQVYAYAIEGHKAIRIQWPDEAEKDHQHQGNDSFFVQGKYFIHRFPVYDSTAANAAATNQQRIIRYQLIKASSVYKLEPVK